jgi:hypothetical protein
MSKLASAAEFNALVDSGKYESKTNAQRAAGRTRLSDAEKKKCFAHIEAHFGADGTPAPVVAAAKKASKKVSKKASKKVAAKKKVSAVAPVPTQTAPVAAPEPAAEAAPAPTPKASKRLAKKVAKKKASKKVAARAPRAEASPPPGTLPISPAQVETTGDMLKLIDSTVTQGVSILGALKRADELGPGGISEGVETVKKALVGAAQLLQKTVVAPLHQTVAPVADAEVTARLAQVVQASNDPFSAPAQEHQLQQQPQHEYSTMPQMPPPPPPGTPLS